MSLPTLGQDPWGTTLDNYLGVSLNANGSLAVLTPNPIPHTPGTGLTSEASLRGSSVIVRDEKLNAVEAGYLVQGSSADQHTGLQSFLTAIGTAVGGLGGSGYVPSGVYHMGSGTVTYPAGIACSVEGEAPLSSFGAATTINGGTTLQWDTDVGGAPHVTYGITLGGSGVSQTLSRMGLYGPPGGSGAPGNMPCSLGGVNARENSVLRDLDIAQFSSCVGFGGSSQSFDHSAPRDIRASSCGYAFNFLPGSNGSGDLNVKGCNLTGGLAAVGAASGAGSLAGSSWVGCGLYGPIGIHRYNDSSGTHGAFMTQVTMANVNFETSGVASIFDDLWANNSLGGYMTGCVFTNGVGYLAPTTNGGFNHWSGTFTCTGTGSTITISSGLGSFVFWPGMTVTGSGITAGSVINSISPSWPYGGSVTLTLSHTVSSPASVTIGMPLLATWVVNTVSNVEVLGPLLGQGGTAYPLISAGFTISYCRFSDASTSLTQATSYPLVTGSGGAPIQTWANVFGCGGDVGSTVLGTAYPVSSVAAGDVLMSDGQGFAAKCDGTRRPLGIAVRANNGSTSGNVDYLVRASWLSAATIPVNNKSAGNIAANALLKVDVANPGGVTTASSPNDGWVIGQNGGSIINAGTSGTINELWL